MPCPHDGHRCSAVKSLCCSDDAIDRTCGASVLHEKGSRRALTHSSLAEERLATVSASCEIRTSLNFCAFRETESRDAYALTNQILAVKGMNNQKDVRMTLTLCQTWRPAPSAQCVTRLSRLRYVNRCGECRLPRHVVHAHFTHCERRSTYLVGTRMGSPLPLASESSSNSTR